MLLSQCFSVRYLVLTTTFRCQSSAQAQDTKYSDEQNMSRSPPTSLRRCGINHAPVHFVPTYVHGFIYIPQKGETELLTPPPVVGNRPCDTRVPNPRETTGSVTATVPFKAPVGEGARAGGRA